MANVWFGLVSAYSAQPIYTTAAIATFNVLWTSFPTIAFACFDQDVSASTVMRNPQLYLETANLTGRGFLVSAAWWLSSALWHSLWCFFATAAALGNGAAVTASGKPWDTWAVGVAAFTCVVITCNAKVMLQP
jgi:phospholipid-translocating ATPase/phospholipid-transporting ATPase